MNFLLFMSWICSKRDKDIKEKWEGGKSGGLKEGVKSGQ